MSTAEAPTALVNRLRKNARHLGRWARREGLEAWRVYDRDIPEFPYAIDRYGAWLHVQLFDGKRALEDTEIALHVAAIGATLEVETDRTVLKVRRRQRGLSQYEKLADATPAFTVTERGLKFEVNLGSYLDTGLFLDHRDTRARVRATAAGKRFLNLFAYTGSFSVYAAAGGAAETVTVDLSNTYQAWSGRNFALNGFELGREHRLVAADVLSWIDAARASAARYDLIVLDPPSFSNSKRMQASFDVQRDHRDLLERTAELLAPGGQLYFSTNRQGFHLDDELVERFRVEEITPGSVPEDFRRHRPHRCWIVTRSAAG